MPLCCYIITCFYAFDHSGSGVGKSKGFALSIHYTVVAIHNILRRKPDWFYKTVNRQQNSGHDGNRHDAHDDHHDWSDNGTDGFNFVIDFPLFLASPRLWRASFPSRRTAFTYAEHVPELISKKLGSTNSFRTEPSLPPLP